MLDLVDKIGEKKDVPIILNSLSMDDTYEGDFSTRRALIYTLKFTAKTYLFGPVSNEDVSKDIIKKVNIGFISGDVTSSPRRELTYSVEPVATKSYTNNYTPIIQIENNWFLEVSQSPNGSGSAARLRVQTNDNARI